MDPMKNDEEIRPMRIVRMVQEIRVIAVCEVEDENEIKEKWVIVDSLLRPLPIPYNEAQ